MVVMFQPRGLATAQAVVFYYSRRPGQGRSAIQLEDGRIVYVRAELHNCDLITALDRARPQAGEQVLNSADL